MTGLQEVLALQRKRERVNKSEEEKERDREGQKGALRAFPSDRGAFYDPCYLLMYYRKWFVLSIVTW